MEIILSTRNPSKLLQILTFFDSTRIKVFTLSDVGIEGDVEEDGATLEENAEKKARFAHEHIADKWVMADDTGLYITALDGAPGIHAARWAGDVTTDEITQFTLEKMRGCKNRSATFKTDVVVLSPDGKKFVFSGAVCGTLLESPRVRPQPKMPYSPLFVPDGHTRTWAEMTTEEENAISHRGIAFTKVRRFLESIS